jgi:hypothetical protein
MKYLEDTLAAQCLSLYPTKIHVRRKKVEGTLMTYTNELEVEVDFSDVDPSLWKNRKMIQIQQWQLYLHLMIIQINQTLRLILLIQMNPIHKMEIGSSSDESKSAVGGRAARFFRKKAK